MTGRRRAAAAALWTVLAVTLFAAAFRLGRSTDPADAATTGRRASRLEVMLRPLLLPFLWNDLLRASRRERVEQVAARGRTLLELLPEWTAGHVYFAGQLAFATSSDGGEAAAGPATDRLQAALIWLETLLANDPACAHEVLPAMASFVEIRARQNPAVAKELRVRLGAELAEIADRYLQRALQGASTAAHAVRERRIFLQMGVVAGALRAGDTSRALATIAWMREQLARTLRDRELAAGWDEALALLDRYLREDPEVSLAQLRDIPYLEDLVELLARR